MSDALKDLLERRASAFASFEEFANELLEQPAVSPEDEQRRAELRDRIDRLDGRIDEVKRDEERAARLETEREKLQAAAGAGDATRAAVVSEPRTYSDDSPHSYFVDLAMSSVTVPGSDEARSRIARHAYEAAKEAHAGSKEGRSAVAQVRELRRSDRPDSAPNAEREFRAMGASELRTGVTTGSGSLGAFVVPQYLLDDYAPYREYGRAFADQCRHMGLPDYGMTINVPAVQGPAAVAAQGGENTAITETDPTAGYLSATLTTEAGQVTVSQQYLDRAGPGQGWDKIIYDQLKRDYAPKVDVVAINAALASPGSVTFNGSSFQLVNGSGTTASAGVGGFIGFVGQAKSNIRTTNGTVLNPSHLFLRADRWEYISNWADENGRPVVIPGYAGAFQAWAAGNEDGDSGIEGNTGYRLNGLGVFTDQNLPLVGGRDQAVVAAMDTVLLFEGTPVLRAVPQTLANQLSVLIQLYSYVCAIPLYPAAVQQITGTAMAQPIVF